MEKRGMSNIIATVLIILLVLAAAIIIWIAIKNITQKTLMSARDEMALIGISFSIIDESVVVESYKDVSFVVEREPGGENVSAFPVIVLGDSWGYSKSTYKYNKTILNEFERIKVEILGSEHGLQGNLKRILVYPAFTNEEGEIITSRSPSDAYEIREGTQTGQGDRIRLNLIVTPDDNAGTIINASGAEYPQTSEYWNGTVLTLIANVTNENYTFFNWLENGGQIGTSPTMQITLDNNRSITANFVLTSRIVNLTLNDFPEGVGNITNESGIEYPAFSQYLNGTSLTLIARATNENYTFINWLENGVVFDMIHNPLIFNITTNRNITAKFISFGFDFFGKNVILPDLISWISNVNVNCGYVGPDCLCNVGLDVTIKNIGGGGAGPSMTVLKIDYSVISQYSIPPLNPNQNYTSVVGITSLPARNYILSLYADKYNTVRESNETNNGFTTPLDAHC